MAGCRPGPREPSRSGRRDVAATGAGRCDATRSVKQYPAGPPAELRSESGFTLVMVVIAIAIMAIMMAVAVQTVEFQMRREREAELIFRGGQYVEAIRLYKKKYGRYPMRLKEIWEADPKVIRRKFKDPITGSESWGLVFQGQEGQELAGGGRQQGRQAPGRAAPMATPTPSAFGSGPGAGLAPEEGERVGPIVGVHSTSCDDSIKVYEGRTTYCEWKFVYREDQGGGGQQSGGGRPPQPGGQPTPFGGGGRPGGGGPPRYGPTPTPRR